MTVSETLTVVLWEDRHTDPSVHLFTDRDAAEAWARQQAHDRDRHGDYAEETYDDVLVVRYSCESDRLSVMNAVVDADAGQVTS